VQIHGAMTNPSWWNKQHDSAWDRVKTALKRDWEQTKADFSKKGHELNQGVGDTVKQAAGKEAIPPGNAPNQSWEDVEPIYKYGVGAREQYGAEHKSWGEQVERKLEGEWTSLKHGRAWQDVKSSVRKAWDSTKT